MKIQTLVPSQGAMDICGENNPGAFMTVEQHKDVIAELEKRLRRALIQNQALTDWCEEQEQLLEQAVSYMERFPDSEIRNNNDRSELFKLVEYTRAIVDGCSPAYQGHPANTKEEDYYKHLGEAVRKIAAGMPSVADAQRGAQLLSNILNGRAPNTGVTFDDEDHG